MALGRIVDGGVSDTLREMARVNYVAGLNQEVLLGELDAVLVA